MNSVSTETPWDRANRLGMPLRRHFGPLLRGEPSMVFRPDGTVRVVIGEHIAELNADQAEEIAMGKAA